jgi:putative phosphoribosyl transferase
MTYRDRTDAGKVLARMLQDYRMRPCVVLGLPNGGIPVGIEIARELGCDFDLVFVSKITPKFNTEIGYGSVSESGAVTLNEDFIRRLGMSASDVEDDIEKTRQRVARRVEGYRRSGERCDVRGRTAILVDDGIASGYTMMNAVDTVKGRGAGEVVVAVPTAPLRSHAAIGPMVDRIVCPDVRDAPRFAVADAYDNWYDIGFDEAVGFLRKYGFLDE